MPLKIDRLFAFIVVDEKGDEGIPAKLLGTTFYPLVGADMDRIESLKIHAQEIANLTQRPMKIVVFEKSEEIGEIRPQVDENLH